MRHRTGIIATGLLALAATAAPPIVAASAKEVRYPAAHPRVSLDVPDDWDVAETPLGLELQSPQKDSLVLAAMTGGDRKSVDGWARRALDRMTRQGVVFAKTGPAKPAADQVARSTPDKSTPDKSTADKPAADKPIDTDPKTARAPAADIARANGINSYTFAGAPTVRAPEILGGANPRVANRDLQTLTDKDVDAVTMKPSGHFLYTGGVLRGQPVDVELSVFPIDKSKRLLTEQQSGATDVRGVMIVRSLRDLTR